MAPTASVAAAAVGLQAQDPGAARLGVRARSGAVDEASVLDALRLERSAVRTWLMRSTVHLVAAEDLRWMTTLFGPMIERSYRTRWRQLGITEPLVEAAVPQVRELLDGRGLTRHEIAAELAARGIRLANDGQAATHLQAALSARGVTCRGPDRGRDAAFVLIDDWVAPGRGPNRLTGPGPGPCRLGGRPCAPVFPRVLGRPVALEVESDLLASGACVRSCTQKRARPVLCAWSSVRLPNRAPVRSVFGWCARG